MQLENHPLNLSFSLGYTAFRLQRMVLESLTHPIPLHNHGTGCFEFHYILSGKGTVLSDGIAYPAGSGAFYVTGPLVEHAQTSDPGSVMEEYCLYLKVAEKRQAAAGIPPEIRSLLRQFHDTKSCFLPQAPSFGHLMTAIFNESQKKDTWYSIQIESLFKELLVLLVRTGQKNSEAEKKKKKAFMRPPDRTLLLIDDAFLYEYPSLSLDGLAAKLNLSRRQTERLLKQYYGKTFQQKKTDARMAAAVVLLDKQASITETADGLGFSSVEHFSAAFKKYYGVTPTAYRRKEMHSGPQEGNK